MAQLLYGAAADVNAGRITGLLLSVRYGNDDDRFVCAGVYGDDPQEAAAVADSLADALRERQGRK
jgi:hypothetical protein